MSEFLPIVFGVVFMAIVSVVTVVFLRLLVPSWWQYRWIRMGAYNMPIFGTFCILIWVMGTLWNVQVFHGIGASGVALAVVVQLAMLLSLPISGGYHWVLRHLKKNIISSEKIDPKRRKILKAAAFAFPVAAMTTGTFGVANSRSPVNIPLKRMRYPGLPQGLDGLKILQISDAHLGYYVILEDLEEALKKAAKHKPDLIAITGDLADNLTALPYALGMISDLKPRFGAYACLGNHEYYRGINEVIKAFSESSIPLLVGTGVPVNIDDDTKLFIAGSDDPRFLSRGSSRFFQSTVDESLNLAPEGAFRILMSHRPQGFEPAARRGVELTLAGHTHGGQIGFSNNSIFEYMMPGKYLWGKYEKPGGSQLYTSCGMGHWFPFRLGCPQELPIIVLERG